MRKGDICFVSAAVLGALLGNDALTKPDESIAQAIICDRGRLGLSLSARDRIGRWFHAGGFLALANGALAQEQLAHTAPAKMRVDALDERAPDMLEFNGKATFHAHDEGGGLQRKAGLCFGRAGWPLQFDRLADARQPLANDLIPIENQIGCAKALLGQNRVHGFGHEIGKRKGFWAAAGGNGHAARNDGSDGARSSSLWERVHLRRDTAKIPA